MLSFGMFSLRAAMMADRSAGLDAGSSPALAAICSSRVRRVKILARFLSCAPLRYMMFLNWE